jgi:hypothetical protein
MRISAAVAGSAIAVGLGLVGCSVAGNQASGYPHTVLLANDGRPAAEIVVTSGADSITIGTGTYRGPLVKARTPFHSGVRPVLRLGHQNHVVWVGLDHTGRRGPADLRIWLNRSVRWRIVLAGGAPSLKLDLTRSRLSGLDIKAGFSAIAAHLPDPSGRVTMTMSGGASRVGITTPRVPARLSLSGGASFVTVWRRSYTGVSGGTVLSTPGWANAAYRYYFDIKAGISSITIVRA